MESATEQTTYSDEENKWYIAELCWATSTTSIR